MTWYCDNNNTNHLYQSFFLRRVSRGGATHTTITNYPSSHTFAECSEFTRPPSPSYRATYSICN